MTDKVRKVLQWCFRGFGYEFRKYRAYIPPEDRQVTLRQLTTLSFGEITLTEARFLIELVRTAPSNGPLIEIGTLFGWSTRVMTLAKPADQPLITVDSFEWNPWELTADEHRWFTTHLLADATAQLNVRQVVMDKNLYFEAYEGPAPALVFMDAGHTYEETKRDLEFAKKVRAQVICGHDYNAADWPGVVQAVNEFGGPRRLEGSLWVL